MNNFPIYCGEYKLNKEDMIRYVFQFDNHSLKFKTIEDKILFSEHMYRDNLHIKIQWLISTEIEKKEYTTQDLFFLMSIGSIYPVFGRIVSHSRKRIRLKGKAYVENTSLRNQFVEHVLLKDIKQLTNVEYKKLEFTTKEKTSLPDSYFMEFQQYISNNVLFERYYESKETQT